MFVWVLTTALPFSTKTIGFRKSEANWDFIKRSELVARNEIWSSVNQSVLTISEISKTYLKQHIQIPGSGNTLLWELALRKKCPYPELFWLAFFL